MHTAKIFNRYAGTYEQKFERNPVAKYQRSQIHELIRPYLNSDIKILDVGCGTGSDFLFYQSLNLNIDAIDISSNMIDLAKSRSEELNFDVRIMHSDLQNFTSPSKYDVIILNFGVINVFADLTKILNKLISLLQKEGLLILVSMPRFHLFFFLERLPKMKFTAIKRRLFQQKAELNGGFKIYYYGKKDFTSLFQVIKRRNLGPFLPTPDQYARWKWAKIMLTLFMKVDSMFAGFIPDWLGGDHICYILAPDKSRKKYV